MSLSERVELPQQVPIAATLFHEERDGVEVLRAGRLLGSCNCDHLAERATLRVNTARDDLIDLVLHAEHA